MPGVNIVNVSEKQKQSLLMRMRSEPAKAYEMENTSDGRHYKSSKKAHVPTIGKQDL
jgi:hypothetical protein